MYFQFDYKIHSEIEGISKELIVNHYAVIENFLPDSIVRKLYKMVQSMHLTGVLTLGATGGGITGNGEKTDGKRFDLITYININDEVTSRSSLSTSPIKSDVVETKSQKTEKLHRSHSVFGEFIKNLDGTVHALCCNISDLKNRVINRGNLMVSCYEPDAFYISHVDNPNQNGRILTALLYLNPLWEDGDGGELRIHRCECKTHSDTLDGGCDGDQCILIQPVINRLLLFWSDKRNLHEVLPTTKNRYAVSCWYQDVKEAFKANSPFS